jgi:hypothetical protein
MGLKVELDYDSVDVIVEQALLESYKNVKGEIKTLQAKKNRKDFQDEDLEFLLGLEKSFIQVCKYFIWNFENKAKLK